MSHESESYIHFWSVTCMIIYTVMFLLYWLTRKWYESTFDEHREEWKQFQDYPIFFHGRTRIGQFYTATFILIACFFICMELTDEITARPFIIAIFIIPLAICVYFMIFHGQIHLLLIVCTIWDDFIIGKNEKLTVYEIGKKQIEKKLWIWYFHRAILIRDFILTPSIFFLDHVNLKEYHFALTITFVVAIHSIIYAFLSVLTILYIITRCWSLVFDVLPSTLNPLQAKLFYQIVTITLIQVTLFAICSFLPEFSVSKTTIEHICFYFSKVTNFDALTSSTNSIRLFEKSFPFLASDSFDIKKVKTMSDKLEIMTIAISDYRPTSHQIVDASLPELRSQRIENQVNPFLTSCFERRKRWAYLIVRKEENDLRWGVDTIRPHQHTDKTTTSSLLSPSRKRSLKTTYQKWKGLSEQPNINNVLAGTPIYYGLMICLPASLIIIITTIVFPCRIASAYKAFYQKNLEAWKKLPEFPIFSHANYIHENVYARYQNSLLISILTIICCAIHLSQTISL
ncbi:Protein CBG17004 [Caenorhabditis briggsae]|uniref:Protein CBG17004 n=1 Tax=Caenorhabditis briggsae TaxID=6238 RepID=A8XQ89_CAEBR|nr:Protein CBG17004 [Caenorhabditis briggsae]CAP34815.1 Protein CBG17004 [Caenorhabditis briggsae]